MSRDRLEEIKNVNNDIKRFHGEFDHKQADIAKCYFYEKYGSWLIEQAERVQELEEIEQEYVDLNNDFTNMALERKRYLEAKKQIEEKYEYFQDAPSSVSTGLSMAIEILDKALEGESE